MQESRLLSFISIVVLFLSGLLMSACQQSQEAASEEAEAAFSTLDVLRDQWQEAYRAGDVDSLTQMWTEEGVLMPPSRRPVTGRSQIRENYQLLFDNYSVVLFELHPDETKIEGDWAFERGVVRAQLTPLEGAVQLSEQAAESLKQSEQAQNQKEGQTQEGPSDISQGTFVRSDFGSYVAVLRQVDEGWKLHWVIGNNPPETRVPVTAEAGQAGKAR